MEELIFGGAYFWRGSFRKGSYSEGLIFGRAHIRKGSYSEGLIFGAAYMRREICVSKSARFIHGRKFMSVICTTFLLKLA